MQRYEGIVQALRTTINGQEQRVTNLQAEVAKNAGLEVHLSHASSRVDDLQRELDTTHRQNRSSLTKIQTLNENVRTLQSEKNVLQVSQFECISEAY